MPVKRSRLKCRHLFVLIALLVPAAVNAQTGRVTMSATVSPLAALSAPPITGSNVELLSSDLTTVQVSLSGDDQSAVVRVPLLVRSNSSFKITALFDSKTAVLSEFSIADVRATGTLVAPQSIGALSIKPQIDPDTSQPLLVAAGPRVSLGGNLNSPNNALEITVLIRLKPAPSRAWSAHLTFVATAAPPTP